MPTVTLAKKLERALRDGHPWIFRDALRPAPAIPDGTVVEVLARNGRPIATGFWDAASPIAVRVLEVGPKAGVEIILRARLEAALALRLALLDRTRTNAFRWVHGEADRLPGLHVDLYDEVAVVRFDGGGARAFYAGIGEELVRAARPLTLRGIVDRGGETLFGNTPDRLVVRENGLLFEADPGHAGKGGLFLDQRENREEVGRRAKGLSVLNLFGYTGGFSLYAARGGAVSTDTVDVSKPALAAARRNFGLNGLPLDRARFHAADAFEFLEAAARRGERWDLVVSDPPSFAPSRASLPAARRAYTRLHRLAAAVVGCGGTLCAASCSSHFRREDLVASAVEGARATGRRFVVEAVKGPGVDHPEARWFPEGDYLKFAIGRME